MKIMEIVKIVLFVIVCIFAYLSLREEFEVITIWGHLGTAAVSFGFTYLLYWAVFKRDWSTGKK